MEQRWNQPPEPIDIYGWRGKCRYCKGGEVVVLRHPKTMKIQPDKCHCLLCGQNYFVEIDPAKVPEWEQLQWEQKARQFADRKTMELINKALEPTEAQKLHAERLRSFFFGYVAAKGWARDPYKLTHEQIMEIYKAQNQETFEV